MRFSLLFLFFGFLLLTPFSCRKPIENTRGIIGNWKLVELYDGYTNGGNFRWNAVPAEDAHVLSFSDDGIYLKTSTVNGAPVYCSGTYNLQANNSLEINSTCNTVTERAVVSELTSKILILDRSGIEGLIRYKYKPSE